MSFTSYPAEDISVLCPQIPTSVDDTTGLIRALESGTEEVNRLLRKSCNLILECRCCKSVFRHPERFHEHKLTVCRAYHVDITPTYEQVLAFQQAVAEMYDHDEPSTSKRFQFETNGIQMEMIDPEDSEDGASDDYDGLEEFCGSSRALSEEPTETSKDMGAAATDSFEGYANDAESEDVVMDGESTEDTPPTYPPTPSSFKTRDLEVSGMSDNDAFDEESSSSDDNDAISLPESLPPDGHLDFPIFDDGLLESPTDSDYFGKDDQITPHTLLHTGAQLE
ncbi:hypothetical protein Q1695_008780 [Nippostrongylus brasiliensis]|nr:hypothetical protein Q1695_008780 [Nippostrongylus brasiliensis]